MPGVAVFPCLRIPPPVFDITFVTLAVALLWLLVAFVQPLAVRLSLPPSVLFAGVGLAIGSLAAAVIALRSGGVVEELAQPVASLPVPSAVFLYVFLPVLILQATLAMEVRRVIEDLAPILLLAVVAVIVAAAVIGMSLNLLFDVPILACLLLGAIVATTDPAAVVAVFRDIGAPARLTRLVEGEALLNDAAAIALFSLLMGLILGGQALESNPFILMPAATEFLTNFFGGILLGYAGGRLVVWALPLLGGQRAAEATLVLATPYIVYILGDRYIGVSGVVAVVVTGLTLSALLRRVMPPGNWKHLLDVGEQVSFWLSSLVFMLAALLVPRLLADIDLVDILMVVVVVVAALAARALVLYVMLPAISAAAMAERISQPFKLTILWGGLRGAVTLALALAMTENHDLDPELKRFVAVTATGFVLFTLFVNGLTLRWLTRLLGLDRLSPIDQALRGQVVALALADVRDGVAQAAEKYDLPPEVGSAVAARYDLRSGAAAQEAGVEVGDQANAPGIESALTERDRLALALIALAGREQELLLTYHEQGALSPSVVGRLTRQVEGLLEGARGNGRLGYIRAARRMVEFGRPFRIANTIHRYLRLEGPLRRELAVRFEALLAQRLALTELRGYLVQRIPPLLGQRIADLVGEMLQTRLSAVTTALDALRLQYPDYAEALETNFLSQLALRQELAHYEALRAEGLFGPELYENLRRATLAGAQEQQARVRLDLGLDTRQLIRRFPLFASLSGKELDKIRRLLRPVFAPPGEVVIRAGDRGRQMYFISSGAVEIRRRQRDLPPIRLGRGDVFGEMALLTGQPRTADVVALGYCQLLMLDGGDFDAFLQVNPGIREHVERVMREREAANRQDGETGAANGQDAGTPDAGAGAAEAEWVDAQYEPVAPPAEPPEAEEPAPAAEPEAPAAEPGGAAAEPELAVAEPDAAAERAADAEGEGRALPPPASPQV